MTQNRGTWSADEMGGPPASGTAGAPPPLVPPPPPPPAEPQRDGPPWEHRTGALDLGAMFATVKDVLFDAPRAFAGMIREGGLGGPILFLLILGTVCGWISMAWEVLLSGAMSGMRGLGGSPAPELEHFMEVMQSGSVRLAMAMLLPALVLVMYFIVSGVLHLMLLLVGGAHQSFETTARVAAYTLGATSVFEVIPFCGDLIASIWALVVLIIGLAGAHETGMGRSAAAVLLPVVLCCLCCVLLVALGAAGLASALHG